MKETDIVQHLSFILCQKSFCHTFSYHNFPKFVGYISKFLSTVNIIICECKNLTSVNWLHFKSCMMQVFIYKFNLFHNWFVGQHHLSNVYLSDLQFHSYVFSLVEMKIEIRIGYIFIKRACQEKAFRIILFTVYLEGSIFCTYAFFQFLSIFRF